MSSEPANSALPTTSEQTKPAETIPANSSSNATPTILPSLINPISPATEPTPIVSPPIQRIPSTPAAQISVPPPVDAEPVTVPVPVPVPVTVPAPVTVAASASAEAINPPPSFVTAAVDISAPVPVEEFPVVFSESASVADSKEIPPAAVAVAEPQKESTKSETDKPAAESKENKAESVPAPSEDEPRLVRKFSISSSDDDDEREKKSSKTAVKFRDSEESPKQKKNKEISTEAKKAESDREESVNEELKVSDAKSGQSEKISDEKSEKKSNREETEETNESAAAAAGESSEKPKSDSSALIRFRLNFSRLPRSDYICALYASDRAGENSLVAQSERVADSNSPAFKLEIADPTLDSESDSVDYRFVLYDVADSAALTADRIFGFVGLSSDEFISTRSHSLEVLSSDGEPMKKCSAIIQVEFEGRPVDLLVSFSGIAKNSDFVCALYHASDDGNAVLDQTERQSVASGKLKFSEPLTIPAAIANSSSDLRFVLYTLSSKPEAAADSVDVDKIYGYCGISYNSLLDSAELQLAISDSDGNEIADAEISIKTRQIKKNKKSATQDEEENENEKEQRNEKVRAKKPIPQSDETNETSYPPSSIQLLVSGSQFPLNDYLCALYLTDSATESFQFLSQTEQLFTTTAPQFKTILSIPLAKLTEQNTEFRFAIYHIPENHENKNNELQSNQIFGSVVVNGAAIMNEKEIRIKLLDSNGDEMDRPSLIIRKIEIENESESFERKFKSNHKHKEEQNQPESEPANNEVAEPVGVDDYTGSDGSYRYPPHLANLSIPQRVHTLRSLGDSVLRQPPEEKKKKSKAKKKTKNSTGEYESESESESDSEIDNSSAALSAFSFANSRSARLHLPDNRSPAYVDPVHEESSISVFVGTWNLHAQPAPPSLEQFLPLTSKKNFDLYVIGTQECENTVEMSLILSSKARWSSALRSHFAASYVELAQSTLQASHLIIFARRSLMPYLHSIQTAVVPTGIGNVLGNKGGIAISLEFGHTSFLFINCHFAPHQNRVADRNAHFHAINERLSLGKSPHAPKLATDRFDRVFWFGDLNYRINGNRQMVDALIQHGMMEVLLVNDQLNQERYHGRVFNGFIEGPIRFQPTYKFDHNSTRYDSSSKQRVPAFTDRILWKPSEAIQQTEYTAIDQLRSSDHRPVVAAYRVKVRHADVEYIMAKQLSGATQEKSRSCAIQ